MKNRLTLIIKGTVLSIAITAMLSLVLAAAIYFFEVSEGIETILTFAIAALSCMCGAYAAALTLGSKGLITGGTIGTLYYILLAIVACIIKKDFSLDSHSVIMLVCASASGMFGGVLGMPR